MNHPEEEPRGSPAFAHSPSLMLRTRRVVLAEDDPELRGLLEQWLRYDGYEVSSAEDGDALTRLLRDGRTDLVISDQRLPQRDGLAVVEELRGLGSRVPVLLMTAFSDPQLHLAAHRLGVSAVVDKPFDLDDLRTLIALLLTRDEALAMKKGRPV